MEEWDKIYKRIRSEYVTRGEEDLGAITTILDALERATASADLLSQLRMRFHKLAGSAGTYGFGRVSELSLEAELACRALIDGRERPTAANFERWREIVRDLGEEFASTRRAESPEVAAGGDASLRVLVIDDDESGRAIVRLCLETMGSMDVVEAEDGATGLRLAADVSPDIIILDAIMPGMDGAETLAALAADPVTKGIPVVVMTAYQSARDTAEFRRIGVAGIIRKPFDPSTLAAELRRLFDAAVRRDRSS